MRGYALSLLGVGLLAASIVGGCAQQKLDPPPPPADADPLKIPEPPKPPVMSRPDLPYPRGGRVEIAEGDQGSQIRERAENERVKAEVGVGVKGRRLDNEELVQSIITPARTLFRTQERTVFEIQIPQAMNLFEASNGRKPNSHEEFMQQIVAANNIRLPELPAAERYVYDPKAGELMVERPEK